MIVKVKKLKENARIPFYAHGKGNDSGFDLYATEQVLINQGEIKLVKTALAVEIPSGYEMQIRPRSGLALKNGITVLNTPGTVDSSYRGEVGVILINHGKVPFLVEEGDRIAQGVIVKVEYADFEVVEELSDTERGEGGFGSSGTK